MSCMAIGLVTEPAGGSSTTSKLRQRLRKAAADLKECHDEREFLKKSFGADRRRIAELEAKVVTLEAKVVTLEAKVVTLEAEVTSAAKAANDFSDYQLATEEKLELLTASVAEATAEAKKAREEAAGVTESNKELQKDFILWRDHSDFVDTRLLFGDFLVDVRDFILQEAAVRSWADICVAWDREVAILKDHVWDIGDLHLKVKNAMSNFVFADGKVMCKTDWNNMTDYIENQRNPTAHPLKVDSNVNTGKGLELLNEVTNLSYDERRLIFFSINLHASQRIGSRLKAARDKERKAKVELLRRTRRF